MLLTVRASFQKCPPFASNPCEAVFLCGLFPFCTRLLPPPQRPAESHIRLSLSALSSVLYFATALMVKSADRCCVLRGLPLNSCLFLCNYSHWCAPLPCSLTLCLLAERAHQASLFLGGTAHLSRNVVVSQSLHFPGSVPAIFCLKHFCTCISFGACICAVSPSDLSRQWCCGSSVQWNNQASLDWQHFIKSTILLNMWWISPERWHRNHVTKASYSSKLTVALKADGFHVKGFWCVLRGIKMYTVYWYCIQTKFQAGPLPSPPPAVESFRAFRWRVSKFITFIWIQVYLHSWLYF